MVYDDADDTADVVPAQFSTCAWGGGWWATLPCSSLTTPTHTPSSCASPAVLFRQVCSDQPPPRHRGATPSSAEGAFVWPLPLCAHARSTPCVPVCTDPCPRRLHRALRNHANGNAHHPGRHRDDQGRGGQHGDQAAHDRCASADVLPPRHCSCRCQPQQALLCWLLRLHQLLGRSRPCPRTAHWTGARGAWLLQHWCVTPWRRSCWCRARMSGGQRTDAVW